MKRWRSIDTPGRVSMLRHLFMVQRNDACDSGRVK